MTLILNFIREEHCERAPELLRDGGAEEDLVHAVVSHGYGIRVDVAPEHEMEKVLFAADELTGLIWRRRRCAVQEHQGHGAFKS